MNPCENTNRSSEPPVQLARDRARILVVEDDGAFSELLSTVLMDHGYEVFLAGSVAQGRELLRLMRFELVLSDVRLPGGPGVYFLFSEEISATGTPLLLMTAFENEELQTLVDDMGVRLLRKPFAMEALLERVLETIRAGSEARARGRRPMHSDES
jgi:DNA-binding response OmpR family regulator